MCVRLVICLKHFTTFKKILWAVREAQGMVGHPGLTCLEHRHDRCVLGCVSDLGTWQFSFPTLREKEELTLPKTGWVDQDCAVEAIFLLSPSFHLSTHLDCLYSCCLSSSDRTLNSNLFGDRETFLEMNSATDLSNGHTHSLSQTKRSTHARFLVMN